jgi:aminodeoxyfutalosine deaminase
MSGAHVHDGGSTDLPRSLRARWVFPVAGPPLADAAVTIAGGRIVAVEGRPRTGAAEDLGDVALVPGLVNAHTHLEFSDLSHPIGNPRLGMAGWLRAVMEHRAALVVPPSAGGPSAPAETGNASPIARGLAESLRYGVTTIGEITQPVQGEDVYHASPCEGTRFVELIAPTIERVEAAVAVARTAISRHHASISPHSNPIPDGTGVDHWQLGLSPHAPYTVHPRLLDAAVTLSREHRIPLAMHLAESPEEIEFLRDGSGPLRELLESRGAWDSLARPRGSRPLGELQCLAQAHRALVVHGNYLDDEEIEFVGKHRQQFAVVYCPRTHAWFGHDPYPLTTLLAAGAVVAMGTDSRASSPDLSLLAEMRQVARTFPALSRATILELGTLGGAKALGRETEIGSLQPGKWANLVAIQLPEGASAGDPHELVLDGEGEVAATWIRGQRVQP